MAELRFSLNEANTLRLFHFALHVLQAASAADDDVPVDIDAPAVLRGRATILHDLAMRHVALPHSHTHCERWSLVGLTTPSRRPLPLCAAASYYCEQETPGAQQERLGDGGDADGSGAAGSSLLEAFSCLREALRLWPAFSLARESLESVKR